MVMVRKSGREMVLYYNPDSSIRVTKLKGVLVRMGIRIRNVAPDQVLDTVGELAGVSGYENRGYSAAPDEEKKEVLQKELPVIAEEMMVMYGFTSSRIDELLAGLRKAGVSKVELKAVVTETNISWSFFHLYEEIKKEHERMTGKEPDGMK